MRSPSDSADAATFAQVRSSLGWILAAVGEQGEVRAVLFSGTRLEGVDALRQRFSRETWTENAAGPAHAAAEHVLRVIEASGNATAGRLRLAPVGTPFQQRVWLELRALRCGETVSYAELARRAGSPRAVRAVAQACGANPIAVLIPCHRVSSASGALAGYRWGVERKRALLEREGVFPDRARRGKAD